MTGQQALQAEGTVQQDQEWRQPGDWSAMYMGQRSGAGITALGNILKSKLVQGCRRGENIKQRKDRAARVHSFQVTPGGCADANFN